MTEAELKKILKKIPKPTIADVTLYEIQELGDPHPYRITPKHVAWAADHNNGMLTADSIKEAEKNGAVCDICKKDNRRVFSRILNYEEHKMNKILFLKIDAKGREAKDIPGLSDYLKSIVSVLEKQHIDGVAFLKA